MSEVTQATDAQIELLAREIHNVYCAYYLRTHGEPYWTNGDYDKLDEKTKDADRDIVRWHLARIDALQAENERLRGLCGETHQHLKNILTTPGTNITGSCYVCHDLLVRLDRASKETI